MWKPKELLLVNFLTHQNTNFTFREGKAILLVGDNQDSGGQKGNGSGKSALNEGISVCVTGESIRKAKPRELVKNGSDYSKLVFVLYNTRTREELEIHRIVYSSLSKSSECIIYENKIQVTSCPDINAYNRYILEKLGLTKEDFFSFFLITKELYTPFLAVGDTRKKEIINRFSGADKIDLIDSFIKVDVDEKEVILKQLNDGLIRVQTKITLLTDELETLKVESSDEKKEEQKQLINEKILKEQEKKEFLEGEEEVVLKELLRVSDEKESLESNKPDFKKQLQIIALEIQSHQAKIENIHVLSKKVVEEFQEEINEIKETEQQCKEELEVLKIEEELARRKIKEEYDSSLQQKKTSRINKVKEKEELENKLAGAIKCPKCSHEFTLKYGDFNVVESQKEVKELEKVVTTLDLEIKELEEKNNQKTKELQFSYEKKKKELDDIVTELDESKNEVNEKIKQKRKVFSDEDNLLNDLIITEKEKSRKVDCEEEQYLKRIKEKIEEINKLELIIQAQSNSKSKILLEIDLLEEQKELLSSSDELVLKISKLETTLTDLNTEEEESKRKVIELLSEKQKIESWYINFKNFKSHLANQSIKNISDYTNLFLSSIGSNISISIEGYRMKSDKKLKEEITTQVFKDGFDVGSYGKFSAGERGRIDICCVLGLQELINLNNPSGGLDLLVCDEILDSVDTLGLESIINSLHSLKRTIMIVSQNEINSLLEDTIIVRKIGGVSTIIN